EAVHLLLAFPLFVCVVAVDPRWIEDCLRQKHHDLFVPKTNGTRSSVPNEDDPSVTNKTQAPVTVGDYLEKIFQIPIWMSPIESRQRAELVKALLGTTATPLLTEPAQARTLPVPVPQSGSLPSLKGTRAVDGFEEIVKRKEGAPDPLQITSDEAQF